MKPYLKAVLFLALLTFLDFLLRRGFVAFLIPFHIPQEFTIAFLFAVFAMVAWLCTRWFARSDGMTMRDLGIAFDPGNRKDFLIGLGVGIGLWALVSIMQSALAGFSWVFNPDFVVLNILHGLVFIFIADLGTELFTRGYPLTRFRDSFGPVVAIVIMVMFVGLKSFSFNVSGELLLYTMLIPALHTVFFSIIYFKTKRLGGALGVHTGANLVTISIFDLRPTEQAQAIPTGLFQPDTSVELLSLSMLQLPFVLMAVLFSIVVYFWWKRSGDI